MPFALAFGDHRHPLILGLIVLMLLAVIFGLIGAAIHARYRRHIELNSRLKSLEDKLDRLTQPPAPPAAK